MKKLTVLSLLVLVAFASCKKDTTNNTTTTPPPAQPQLKFVFKFDNTQTRLDGFGNPSTVPSNHCAQSPTFNGMSAHYIEMTQNNTTAVGHGTVLYTTPTIVSTPFTVTSGSATATYTDAIDFSKETVVGDGQQFFSIPLSQVTAGTYPYLRISVAYQNYDIRYAILPNTPVSSTYTTPAGPTYYSTGTIASFIGYNTQIGSYTIKTQTDVVNAAKQQGYWSFESAPYVVGTSTTTVPYSKGQAPQGATTVVNPLFSTSAVPPGSCLVTGQFVSAASTSTNPIYAPLVITGHETSDIVITVSMSTNNSFEWLHNASNPVDGYIYPLNGDVVVDMGVRGMMPKLPQ
jgi:hypothetical protein